jgi:hypothetical protein
VSFLFSPGNPGPANLPALGLQIRGQISRLVGVTPAYLIPLQPDEIPRSEIGKLQRGRLEAGFEAGAFASRLLGRAAFPTGQDRSPADTTAGRVAQILAAVLEIEAMRVDDNFFNLGGNSLKVAEAVIQLAQTFNQLPLTTVEIFRYPTPRQLALYFDRQNDTQQSVRQGLERANRRRQARRRN